MYLEWDLVDDVINGRVVWFYSAWVLWIFDILVLGLIRAEECPD